MGHPYAICILSTLTNGDFDGGPRTETWGITIETRIDLHSDQTCHRCFRCSNITATKTTHFSHHVHSIVKIRIECGQTCISDIARPLLAATRTASCAALFLACAVWMPKLTTANSSFSIAALIATQDLSYLAHLEWAFARTIFTRQALMSGGIVAGEGTSMVRIPNIA